jgi:MFS family permease
MHAQSASSHRHTTHALTTALHAFTHMYQSILVPLYLLIVADLNLSGVKSAALIVTVCNVVYFLLSYPSGILADRYNRKSLLGIGLIGNAFAFLLLATTHSYPLILLFAAVAGVFGSLFHPAANALVPAHYPQSPGMAIGLMGIGSGVGFFVGSQYSGWRAATVSEPYLGLSTWQIPCLELAIVGIFFGVLFLFFAGEVPHPTPHTHRPPMDKSLRLRVLFIAVVLGLRDFAGVATLTLVSVYLQKAHGYSTKQTGWILGSMGLISIVSTPLSVFATAGRRRLPGLGFIVIAAGLTQFLVPLVSLAWILTVLIVFQVFHLSSYSVAEVAMVELVVPAHRGRAIGLLLTVCGTLGATSPWAMGLWTDLLGPRAYTSAGYTIPFSTLGILMILSSLSIRLMKSLGSLHPMATSEAMISASTEPSV